MRLQIEKKGLRASQIDVGDVTQQRATGTTDRL
jgi:hypothetical protein